MCTDSTHPFRATHPSRSTSLPHADSNTYNHPDTHISHYENTPLPINRRRWWFSTCTDTYKHSDPDTYSHPYSYTDTARRLCQ